MYWKLDFRLCVLVLSDEIALLKRVRFVVALIN
jgi:hypothetical protein